LGGGWFWFVYIPDIAFLKNRPQQQVIKSGGEASAVTPPQPQLQQYYGFQYEGYADYYAEDFR
jgi:hypothetical protein